MAAISPPQAKRASYAIVPRNLGQLARIVIFQCHENFVALHESVGAQGEAVDAAAISSGM